MERRVHGIIRVNPSTPFGRPYISRIATRGCFSSCFGMTNRLYSYLFPSFPGTRCYHHTTPLWCAPGNPSPLEDEDGDILDIELLMPEESDPSESDAFGSNSSANRDSDSSSFSVAESVSEIDSFARAKITNFVNRMSSHHEPGKQYGSVEVQEIQDSMGQASKLFHARIRIPFPSSFGERWGEGIAGSAKEAELVAAMHAERVIDALGFPMFQLTSKQKKHAEAAKTAGRWAPLPGDPQRPPDTPSPPRLQLLRSSANKQVERRLNIHNIQFSPVEKTFFSPMKLTLASPLFMDYEAVTRIRRFFMAYKTNILRFSKVTPLHAHKEKIIRDAARFAPSSDENLGQEEDSELNGEEVYLAQLKLPIDDLFGDRTCLGKASSKKDAFTLACMHAELTIDALGLPLYPNDPDKQMEHANECRLLGRWCAEPGETKYNYSVPTPPPFQLQNLFNGAASTVAAAEVRQESSSSFEELILEHSIAVRDYRRVEELASLKHSAEDAILTYLETVPSDLQILKRSPFFVERLGVAGRETYRATIAVPVEPLKSISESNEGISGAQVSAHDTQKRFFIAIGISTTEDDAKVAAAMNAVDTLKKLNRLNTSHEALPLTKDVAALPVYRYVQDHVGRVSSPGLAFAKRNANNVNTPLAALQKELLDRQGALEKVHWSLEPDADGYIIVNPSVNLSDGNNYVHTLSSVRFPDMFVMPRLRDYLERHGKRLETAMEVSSIHPDGEEPGLRRWTAKVNLPVRAFIPSDVNIIAHGEGYTQMEAIHMCSVHAELVLDHLGEPLYDHPVLQHRHYSTARMLGRWIPVFSKSTENEGSLSNGRTELASCLPPPIRKESEKSRFWKKIKANHTEEVLQKVSCKPIISESPVAEEGKSVESNRMCGGVKTDDELFRLEKLFAIHSTDVYVGSVKHATNYFRNKGGNFATAIRQYSIIIPNVGPVHRAVAEIPVPSIYGKRYAVGCSSTKKMAFSLCAMHVLCVLDALGIPLYSSSSKDDFQRIMERIRVYKSDASSNQLLPAAKKESPPGLCNIIGFTSSITELPQPPPHSELLMDGERGQKWFQYVRESKKYIKKIQDSNLQQCIDSKRLPRSGIKVEDDALDAVEGASLNTSAQQGFHNRCVSAGLEAPPLPLRAEVHIKGAHRRFITEQEVLGTPFTARGIGDTRAESIARAIMHYDYLLRNVVATNNRVETTTTSSHTKNVSSASLAHSIRTSVQQSDYYDIAKRALTAQGKYAALCLFAAMYSALMAPKVTYKARKPIGVPNDDSTAILHVVLVEIETETERLTGKGEHKQSKKEALDAAVNHLHSTLMRKPLYQSFTQLLSRFPQLRLEALAPLVGEVDLFKMQKNQQKNPPIRESDFHPINLEALKEMLIELPLHLVSSKMSEPSWETEEIIFLRELCTQSLCPQAGKQALGFPTIKITKLFPAMGFTSVDQDGLGKITPIAVATALLSFCIPKPLPCKEQVSQSNEEINLTPCTSVNNSTNPSVNPATNSATESSSDNSNNSSSALPLQLAKLLLSGWILHCPQWAIKLCSVVLAKTSQLEACEKYSESGMDIIEYCLSTSDSELAAVDIELFQIFYTKILNNLKQLHLLLTDKTPHFPLVSLMRDLQSPRVNSFPTVEGLNSAAISIVRGRMKQALVFSAFPELWVQTSASAEQSSECSSENSSYQALLSSVETTSTIPVSIPKSLLYKNDSSPSSKSSSHKLLDRSLDLHFLACSQLPCFVSFVLERGLTEHSNKKKNIGEHASLHNVLQGTFIHPILLIMASIASHSSESFLQQSDDVPQLALLDERFPIMSKERQIFEHLELLRSAITRKCLELRSLPEELQGPLDALSSINSISSVKGLSASGFYHLEALYQALEKS